MSLSDYIRSLRENRGIGVAETSSYGALQNLLDSVGANLKPSVRCILHPSGAGHKAGLPDGGLFTREQLQTLGRDFAPQSALQMTPARGAVEVKGTNANLQTLVDSPQVAKYLAQFRKVLCTNYHQFAVVELQSKTPCVLETFEFETSEAAFWAATNDLSGFTLTHEERLRAFLERALLYGAPLASPEAVAAFMASCAREAKIRVERVDVPALERVRSSLEAALDMSFGEREADAFFRSSLVQTLFYGVFSAWILWCRENPIGNGARFNWQLSSYSLRVPVIQALFYEIANPQTVESLGVGEPLRWVEDALNRVDRAAFEERFSDGSAVQYFYEPFLAAFDPKLREQLGVWYTPVSIVRYMVARVDEVLKSELGIAKGLADENVVILDPCCGTGAFLVETIRHIHASLLENGEDALAASDLKHAVLNRLYGFELLTAPFVVAHLQLGLLLQSLGAPLGPNERPQIFLTNALTGWQEPNGEQLKIELPGLKLEKEAAEKVKRQKRILVILGNPPYSGFAGVAINEERELTDAYRTTQNPALQRPEGQGLNELYVRFFRMAERKIVESTQQGIVCYISNYSWLDGKSHTGMREAYLDRFSKVWIDNLHGDRRISEYAPDGRTSETIFAVRGSSVGIRVGTSIALLARKKGKHSAKVLYRDVDDARADERRAALIESLKTPHFDSLYQEIHPEIGLGIPLKPATLNANYNSWPLLPELFPVSFAGVQAGRDSVVVDVDQERLVARMTAYFDRTLSDEEMRRIAPGAMESTKRFDAPATRKTLIGRGFLPQNIVPYFYRPFDVRWLYWEPDTKLLDEKRADYWPHVFVGNLAFAAVTQNRRDYEAPPVFSQIGSRHVIERGANIFPLYLRDMTVTSLFEEEGHFSIRANLSDKSRAYLASLHAPDATKLLFLHALSIQHAPHYRRDNADALRLDWPRIPLPAAPESDVDFDELETELDEDEWESDEELVEAQEARDELLAAKEDHNEEVAEVRALLEQSAALGETIAALQDVLQPVAGITAGVVRAELRVLGNIAKIDRTSIGAGDLRVAAGWGYRAKGAIMPGNGRAIEREWTSEERAALKAGGAALGLSEDATMSLLGATAFDIYLNDATYWRGVPSRVWSYTMGGYRVFKKWLSYRETAVLGRDLTSNEAREATAIVRRIAALLLLEPRLDANYAVCSLTPEAEALPQSSSLLP